MPSARLATTFGSEGDALTRRFRTAAGFVAAVSIVAFCAIQSWRDGCGWPAVVVEHGPLPEVDLAVAETWKVVDRFPSGMTHYPSMGKSRFDPDWVMFHVHQRPGVLLMKLEPWLSEMVWRSLPEQGESAAFCTGDRGFHRLNRIVGLERIRTYGSDSFRNTFAIAFDPEMDVEEAGRKYESLEGVVYAEDDGYFALERQWTEQDAQAELRLPTVDLRLPTVEEILETGGSR